VAVSSGGGSASAHGSVGSDPTAAQRGRKVGTPGRTAGAARRGHAAEELGGVGEQQLLFGEEPAVTGPRPEDVGYRGPTACDAAGITYRQLDYWARTGLVEPSVRAATGSGSQRLYGFRDILVLKVVKRLLDTGISLQQIRAAVIHLRDRGSADLAEVTLMSDGVSVYECTSPDEVVDLLQGGQGVFGIALGRVWQEVEGTLAELPGESAATDLTAGTSADELASRRARKTG
jgi:DNA-binding transcriptional MerR regulator